MSDRRAITGTDRHCAAFPVVIALLPARLGYGDDIPEALP
jgi:hypothetical protein